MSNRLEDHLDRLASLLSTDSPSSPLIPETMVVQSQGMQKWLSLRLAEHLGVWSNCRYLFPNAFINEMYDKLTGTITNGERFFDREAMVWAIMQNLPKLAVDSEFSSIHKYLGETTGSLKLWQLSTRIAYSFDQYLTYRPELISKWDNGEDTHWQAKLWRRISTNAPGTHRARRHRDFLTALGKKGICFEDSYRQRIFVFGIPSLPPIHIEVLDALAAHMDIHVFFLNPSKEYWGDIASPYEQSRAMKKKRPAGIREKELHFERGHPILASMGKMGRDFLSHLMELDSPQPIEMYDNPPPPERGILSVIQNDIFHLNDRGSKIPPLEVSDNYLSRDKSLVINSCHSPMREVEVLKDTLLSLFDDEAANFAPDEILVLTPDIEEYAPYIEAVFGSGEPAIPYTVADRTMHHESALAGVFLSLLDAAPSRFEASRITDLLEHRQVRRRFGIEDGDLPLLRRWIINTRINWSLDESGREKLGLPAIKENTWKAGLDRMLLGYAMPGWNRAMFADILPYDNIEGGDAILLGKLSRFVRELGECADALRQDRTLRQWGETLDSVLDTFFLPGEESVNELRAIEETIAGLSELADASGFDGTVDYRTVRAHLEHAFGESVSSRNFLSGGVTFCAMLPMRSIPFRVICMIGMNDSAFPRQDRALPFDLMAAAPRRGDRSLREEDRYLFLEALISARERLYISYTGQSITDAAEIPSSILVSELIDCVEQTFTLKGAKPGELRARIVTKHPLQPFSHRYFDGELYSYSQENCEASGMISLRDKPRPFIDGPLASPATGGDADLADFIAFFENPARHLARRALNIRIPRAGEELSDCEPYVMEGLEGYGIEDDICRAIVAGDDVERLALAIRAEGRLPHGTPGNLALRKALGASGAIAARVMEYAAGGALPPLAVALEVAGITLRGSIDNLWEGAHVRFRPAAMKAKDLLRGWIHHLFLNACRGKTHPSRTVLIGRPSADKKISGTVIFPGMEAAAAREALSVLARVFLRGESECITLIPECSLAFAREMRDTGEREKALAAASRAWLREDRGELRGEYSDPYFDLCFGRLGDDARFGKQFEKISMEICAPLLANMEEVR